jgi:hypothetical protein
MNEQEIREKWKVIEKDDQVKPGFFQDLMVVAIIVKIRENESGIIRDYPFEAFIGSKDNFPSPFNWKENNFSCDCNRHIFFYNAIGEEPEEDTECTYGKYSVKLVNPVDGKAYYNEFNS